MGQARTVASGARNPPLWRDAARSGVTLPEQLLGAVSELLCLLVHPFLERGAPGPMDEPARREAEDSRDEGGDGEVTTSVAQANPFAGQITSCCT
jgi:hypothetical protein